MEKKIFLISIIILCICAILTSAQTTSSGAVGVSLLNQNPDPAKAGDIVELRFKVENTGNSDVNNVKLELITDYPFTTIAGENYVNVINQLSAQQTGDNALIVKYKVRIDKNAVKGLNQIKLKVTSGGTGVYSTNTFDVQISSVEFAQITIDTAKLDPGKETKVKFTITNTGSSPLQNVIFSWDEAKGAILPVYSDVTKYVKFLDIGESVDLEYTVIADVNAIAGLYPLTINMKFDTDTGVSSEVNTKTGMFVGGETDFDVTFSESTAGQTSLSVANIGNNPALSVTVRIPDQENFRVTGSTSSIIGNLDKGDYTLVSFQITQSGQRLNMSNLNTGQQLSAIERQKLREQFSQQNLSVNNNLEVLIDYTDTTGVRHSVDKEVPIQFRTNSTMAGRYGQTQTATTSSTTKYIIIAVVLVVLIICFRKRAAIINLFKISNRKK